MYGLDNSKEGRSKDAAMIKSILLIAYNVLRIALNKMLHLRRFDVHWMQRISPLCALKVFHHGKISVGRNCEFAAYCDFEVHGKGTLEIGDGTYFNRYCMISAHEHVTIGKHCMFGPGVKIFDNNHRHSPETGVSSELNTAPIFIGDNCWVCSDAIILKGTHIGKNCVIGAGCIVRGDVPDGSVVTSRQEFIVR